MMKKLAFSSYWVRMRWTSGRLFKPRNGHFRKDMSQQTAKGWG